MIPMIFIRIPIPASVWSGPADCIGPWPAMSIVAAARIVSAARKQENHRKIIRKSKKNIGKS